MPSLLENGRLPHNAPWRPNASNDASSSCRIPVDELLTSRFLSRHTKYSSFEALLGASGLSARQFSNLEDQTDSTWEAFIRRISCFSGWGAMLRDARGEWVMRRLGIVIDG